MTLLDIIHMLDETAQPLADYAAAMRELAVLVETTNEPIEPDVTHLLIAHLAPLGTQLSEAALATAHLMRALAEPGN